MGIYDNLNNQDGSGELRLWRAWLTLHIADFLYPDNSAAYHNAKVVLFGKNSLFKQVCDWLNFDMHIFRRNIIKLKRLSQRERKNPPRKFSRNKVENLIKKLSE